MSYSPPPGHGSDPYGTPSQPGQQPGWPPQPTAPNPAQQPYGGPDQEQWQQGSVPYGGQPPMPPVQPPKKKRTGLVIAGGVVGGLLVIGAIGNALGGDRGDATPAADPTTQVEDATTEPETTEAATSGDEFAVGTVDVGACLNSADLTATDISEIPTVPCTEEHDAQAIGKFDMDGSTFPGDDAVASAAEEGCRSAFLEFTGVSYDESALGMRYVGPSQDTWEQANDREVICFAFAEGGDTATTSWEAGAESEETTQQETEPAEVESTEDEPELTISQRNAIDTAQSYLDYTGFSRSGLIDQLEYEGYSNEDATFAVDHLDVDWNEQAAVVAQNYLDYSSFSRQGLLDQLLYEGFTQDQAEYGLEAVGY